MYIRKLVEKENNAEEKSTKPNFPRSEINPPYPHKFRKQKDDKSLEIVLDMFKNLQINI